MLLLQQPALIQQKSSTEGEKPEVEPPNLTFTAGLVLIFNMFFFPHNKIYLYISVNAYT